MDTHDFDRAVIAAVFARAGLVGWRATSLVEACRDSGLELGRVRVRFPGKTAVLLRFGVVADQEILAVAPAAGTAREKVFDLVMARFDQVQRHRGGIMALTQSLRSDPGTALMLHGATLRSMRWILETAGVPASGVNGLLRVHGLAAVWYYGLRAWEKDEGADLPATMAAVDRALDRAVKAEDLLPCRRAATEVATAPTLSGTAVVASEDGPSVI